MFRFPCQFLGTARGIVRVLFFTAIVACLPSAAAAEDWTVTVTLLEATSLSDDDASGPDDIYWIPTLAPTLGSGLPKSCSSFSVHTDDQNHIEPGWTCVANVSGGPDTTMQIVIELREHDTTSADDHFDIHPDPGNKNLLIAFRPKTFDMTMNVAGWTTPRCVPGRILMRGLNGDDRAEVVFTISASLAGAPTGDSDGDGLLDSWEACGIDTDSDGVVDVDLPAMGAKPERKDVFVETDWMVNNTGIPATAHSHEPWLPAMINAWNEFNAAPVTNPTSAGTPSQPGIALHLDVGTLYAGYALDFDGDGTADVTVPSTGNLDLDGDGIPDIGNLGALGRGTPGGGNALAEVALLAAGPTSSFDSGSGFGTIKAANFDSRRDMVFHYSIFADQYASAPGSSGLAENCGQLACNDFIVSLGGWPRQIVDANRDGIPDPAGPLLQGPSGLPVDGTVAQHAGTFLHELGHNLALGHGGGDGINRKPNYLSIMSYSWQTTGLAFDFNGDLLGDPVAVDFDGDGIVDVRRFIYSNPALPNLNEANLNEPAGIGDASTLTRYSCPPPPPPPAGGFPAVRIAPGAGPIDWNCNGNATEVGFSTDVNFRDGTGVTPLPGFNDYNQIANSGLAFQSAAPGITLQELREMEAATTRIVRQDDEEFTKRRCAASKTIDFDALRPDTQVTSQFSPLATFLLDNIRTPVATDAAGRNGAPTVSPDISLMNRLKKGQFAPLVVEFDPPQRFIGLYAGRTKTGQPTDSLTARAVVQAFDQHDLNMGEVSATLPPFSAGVMTFLGFAAILPDQLVKRIEVRYETSFFTGNAVQWAPIPEPQQIDNLTLCDRLRTNDIKPSFPEQPKFGELSRTLAVDAVLVTPGAASDGEAGHHHLMESPLPGVPVIYNGSAGTTDLTITRPEGQTLNLSAPASFGGSANFVHWRLDDTVFFGDGQNDIALTLLRDGRLTAIYERRKDDRAPPKNGFCDCLRRCCEDREQQIR